MRIECRLLLLLYFLFTIIGSGDAQNSIRFDPLKDEISAKIPPLSVLLDSAVVNNHYVQARNIQLLVDKCKIRSRQVEWTRNIGLQLNAGYGNLYNTSTNEVGDPNAATAINTNRSESQYRIGVYINFPIYYLADRRNLIKMASNEMEQDHQMAELQRDEVRQAVIRQYNDLILKQRLLRIKSKYLETARLNMQMVEKEFANGVNTIDEYARITQIFFSSEADYENAHMEMLTAYMILEEIVGMKFRLIKQISKPNDGN